jgi:hypothetical protein
MKLFRISLPIILLAASAICQAEIFTVNESIALNPAGISSSNGTEVYNALFSDTSSVAVHVGDEITGTISFTGGPIRLEAPAGDFSESAGIFFSPTQGTPSLSETYSMDFQGLAGTFPETNPVSGPSGGCCLIAFQFSNGDAFDFSFTGFTYTINVTGESASPVSVYFSEFSLEGQTVEFGTTTSTPEPSSIVLSGTGCFALAFALRRGRRKEFQRPEA